MTQKSLPEVSNNDASGELGVRIVDSIISDMGHIFREKTKRDYGIDGEIEITKEENSKRYATSKIISVQIKCGESFFTEKDGSNYVFRCSASHANYWIDHSLPVMLIICDPKSRKAYWSFLSPSSLISTGEGFKALIPEENDLSRSEFEISRISKSYDISSFIDLALYKWANEKYFHRIEFATIEEMPRDYHGSGWLCKIDGNETAVIDKFHARYGTFHLNEITDFITKSECNAIYRDNLIICLIAESSKQVIGMSDIQTLRETYPDIEFIRMYLDRDGIPELWLMEVTDDDMVIDEYIRGKASTWQHPLEEND